MAVASLGRASLRLVASASLAAPRSPPTAWGSPVPCHGAPGPSPLVAGVARPCRRGLRHAPGHARRGSRPTAVTRTTGPPSARVPTTPAPATVCPTHPRATTPIRRPTTAAPRTDVLSDPARVGQPWSTTVQGLLTFRGNPTRTWYGTGPLPAAPKILWQYPSQAMCGALAGVRRDQHVVRHRLDRPARGLRAGRAHLGGLRRLRLQAPLPRRRHRRAASSRRSRPATSSRASVTVDPDGYPLVYSGSRDNYFRVIAIDRAASRPSCGR